MALSHHIGVELADRSLRVVELRSQDGFPSILRAEEAPFSLSADPGEFHSAPFHRNLAKDAVRDITTLLLRRPMLARHASIALPAGVPLILRIPVDARLSDDEKRDSITWECRSHFSLRSDAEVRALSVVLERDEAVELHLAVALPTATIAFLRSVLAHLTLELRSMDVVHFVVERALPHFRPLAGEPVAVIGLARDRCVASVFRDAVYGGLRIAQRGTRGEPAHAMLRLLQQTMDAAPALSIRSVHVYGTDGATPIAAQLGAMIGIPVVPFDPLQSVSFQTQADASAAAQHAEGTFTAALCAAWNGLSCA